MEDNYRPRIYLCVGPKGRQVYCRTKRKGANVKSLRIKGSVQLQGVGIDIPFYFRIVSEFEKGCKITDEIKH